MAIKLKKLFKGCPSDLFAVQIKHAGFNGWVREYKFHPKRRWKIDHAQPILKIAVEVEGGTWGKGWHTRGKGYRDDCIKYNHAIELGWDLYRFTTDLVESEEAINFMIRIMGSKQ